MKVALVHDYLREFGGAERVLETLHQMFPQAPIYTAYLNFQGLGIHAKRVKTWDIHTSWLQKLPLANWLISPLRIFAPMIFESFNLRDYDLVISSSSIYFAKAVLTTPKTLHIAYIHTPPRYLYGYSTSFNYQKNWLTKILGELANFFLRFYDFEISQRPDILVANSKNVAERIKKFYRREAVVIYPPVDFEAFSLELTKFNQKTGAYYLSVSRLVRGKGIEIIVQACTQLGLPLKIAGKGPEMENLKKLAGPSVEFLGEVRQEDLAKLYYHAKALVVASEDEDFGITAVEAQSSGTPVIALGNGGYLETIQDGKTGIFFNESIQALTEVLQNFDPGKYKIADCLSNAKKFSKANFVKAMEGLIDQNLKVK